MSVSVILWSLLCVTAWLLPGDCLVTVSSIPNYLLLTASQSSQWSLPLTFLPWLHFKLRTLTLILPKYVCLPPQPSYHYPLSTIHYPLSTINNILKSTVIVVISRPALAALAAAPNLVSIKSRHLLCFISLQLSRVLCRLSASLSSDLSLLLGWGRCLSVVSAHCGTLLAVVVTSLPLHW